MLFRRLLFAFAAVNLTPSVVSSEEFTKELLHQSLQKTIAALDSLHMVVAIRGDNVSIQQIISDNGIPVRRGGVSEPHFNVSFNEIWADGDNVQLREHFQEPNKSDSWWEGFQVTDAPLTADTLDSVVGRKVCFRPEKELMWADYIKIPDSRKSVYRAMYSVSNSPKPTPSIVAPLIELNRKWVPPELSGGMLIVNSVSQIPVDKWKVIGREKVDGSEAVKVEIVQPGSIPLQLKRHSGTLTVTRLWNCWFSIAQGHCPIKIIDSIRYGFGGKEYDYERGDGMDPMFRYVASDVKNVFDDIWFPMAGMQETYIPDYGVMKPFDSDVVVDKLIADGKYIDREPFFLDTRREWKVLILDQFTSVDNLWFDAPSGSCIRNIDAGTLRMQGMSVEDSRKFLNPTGLNPSNAPLPKRRNLPLVLISINAIIVFGLLLAYFLKRRKFS